MADLGNQKIKDTYQLVLQTDTSGNLQNLSGGTPSPFIVNGNLRYADGTQSSGYVLISDGSGNASWGPVAFSGDVYVTGGTIEETTIQLNSTSGDTINIPGLCWSSSTSGHISNSGLTGNVGIGTSTPNEILTVVGDISGTTDLHIDGTSTLGSISVGGQYIYVGGTSSSNQRIFFQTSPNTSNPSYLLNHWGIKNGKHFYFGDDEDLDIYHTGSNGVIDNDTGSLSVLSSTLVLGDTTSETTVQDNLTVNDDLTVNTDNLHVSSDDGLVGVGSLNPTHKLTVSGGTGEWVTYDPLTIDGTTILFANNSNKAQFDGGATNQGLAVGYQVRVTQLGVTHTHTISVLAGSPHAIFELTSVFEGSTEEFTTMEYNTGSGGNMFGVYNGTGTTFQVVNDSVMSGSTDLLDMFASSGITNQDVYWSASTGGISNSGLTGNVGIGTTTPNEALTVVGAISATTEIYANNLTLAGDITSVGDDVSIVDDLHFTSAGSIIKFMGTTGGNSEGVAYKDQAGTERFGLIFPGADVVALANRASNGVVQIRANTSTAGSGGETTVAEFQDDLTTINSNLIVTGNTNITGNTTVTGDIDIDGTTNLDAVDIDGAVQLDGTLTSGVNDTGYDVKFFGATSGKYMLWDESHDALDVVGNLNVSGTTTYIGAISGTGSVTAVGGFVGDVTGNAATVTNGVYTSNNLSVMAATTSTQLRGVLSDETGTGSAVFATSPTLVTPNIGTPSAGNLGSCTAYPGDSSLVTVGTVTTGTWASNRKFTISTTTDENVGQGDILYFGGGSTTAGDLVYMTTAGQWASAQANATGTSTSMLGIALGTDPDVDGVLLKGTYTLDHDVGNDQGVPLYLSDGTAGQATATIPDSSGDVVRIIGYNLGDSDEIFFDPDKTWVQLT